MNTIKSLIEMKQEPDRMEKMYFGIVNVTVEKSLLLQPQTLTDKKLNLVDAWHII